MESKSIHQHFSPHINEIIEKKPNWLIRYGIGSMLFFLLLVLTAAWLVQYPDIMVGQVNITTPIPPSDVIAKINAAVIQKFMVAENDSICKGEPILLLESTTSYEQVQELSKKMGLNFSEGFLHYPDSWLDSLGALQPAYNSFALTILDLKNYYHERPFEKRIKSLQNILSGNFKGLQFSRDYLKNSKKDFESKKKEHDRYKILFKKGVISASEFELIKQSLLQKEMGYANDHKNLNDERISLTNLEREIMELELQKTEYEHQLQGNYLKASNELRSQVEQWKDQYLICAPITGRLSFFNEINEGDFITARERVLTVIPFQKQKLQAVGMFPAANSGKVTKGNKVILKLDAYPYHEYGTVEGNVSRVSEIPIENLYSIVIELPHGLTTNYDSKITFKQRLTATADIVTKDQSVLGRIFYQFESLFKN